ncbi:MAG: hypothetical protein LBR74_07875 [Eubacterium sp.]|jgi:hypothetical protein|nr:hypothetical protein [Eubacterium sp.]
MNKQRKILHNGIILAVIDALLAANFSVRGIWGVPQAAIIALLAFISGLQFYIYFSFFGPKNAKSEKPLDIKKKL